MKREIAVVGMIVCLAGGFLAGWFIPPLFAAPRGDILSKIRTRGELRVGTSTDYPPFEFDNLTSGFIEGFDVDVSRLVADEIGVDLLMVNMDFDALIGACVAGTIDMVAAAMTYDPTSDIGQERAQQLAPSIPYVTVAQVVIVEGSSVLTINNLTDLIGLDVGCQSGTTMEAELAAIPGMTYFSFASALVLIQDLISGTGIDAAYIDEPVFTAWNQTEDLKVILTTGTDPLSLWCRHEDSELLYTMNTVLITGYETNGTLYELLDKWFG
ncbi:MAG: amino acid ABC transporter substrate-binding protein [Candidatus Lokiarchaeota archaeon]|nr:amino acid ABC transporter substrate-binding protein [Candidatus Lokiarchaeota archaeon]